MSRSTRWASQQNWIPNKSNSK